MRIRFLPGDSVWFVGVDHQIFCGIVNAVHFSPYNIQSHSVWVHIKYYYDTTTNYISLNQFDVHKTWQLAVNYYEERNEKKEKDQNSSGAEVREIPPE